MKKILSLVCAMAIVFGATAAPQRNATRKEAAQKIEVQQSPRFEKVAEAAKPSLRAPQATAALTSGTYYTTGGAFYIYYQSSWMDATSYMPSVEVTVDGTSVTIAGLAYYFEEGAIKGTLNGNTITFANGQVVGSDNYGDEYLVGSNDGSTLSDNIVFVYDAEAKTLTASTKFIFENSAADEVSPYAYWYNAVFSAEEPAAPELVELPAGAKVEEYSMAYKDSKGNDGAKFVNVAVVGNDVYFQGMSNYISDSWVKGTKEGNAVTFAGNQYVGTYSSMDSYFFYNGETVFTYDADADTYTATGVVCGALGNQYYDGYYNNPVLSKPVLSATVEVAIVDADFEYDSQYSDAIYTLTNAAKDTTFVLDIYVAKGLKDVEPGKTYTFEDMEKSATYTYALFGETKVGLSKAEFVKTIGENDLARIEATLIDANLDVYHFVYQEKPVAPSGVKVDLFFENQMDIPQYYTDIKGWELYTKSVSGDTVAAFIINSENATSAAGTYTKANLNMEYTGIQILDKKVKIYSASITVTETDERIDLNASILGKDSVTYNVKMFFVKPVATAQAVISSNELEIDASYFSYYGVIFYDAADENNAISLTVNANGTGAAQAGVYVAGTDFNGSVTPTGGEKADIYSGSITIAVNENGDVTLTGTVLATNNVEYSIALKYLVPAPAEITITSVDSEFDATDNAINYELASEDYTFYFYIYLADGLTDVVSGTTYTFADDMNSDIYNSYGERGLGDYIDYASATFVKTVGDGKVVIKAAIEDVNGAKWNLTYEGVDPGTAIDNAKAGVTATKRIVNGQMVIRANGQEFNAQGVEIR